MTAPTLHISTISTLNANILRDEVFATYGKLFRGEIGNNLLLMDDNIRPHHAALMTDNHEREKIQRMEFPAYSPDLNPIEENAGRTKTRTRITEAFT